MGSEVSSGLSYEQVDFKMNSAADDNRLVSAAFALVEADKTSGREFVKRAQHVLLGAAGEDGEFVTDFG